MSKAVRWNIGQRVAPHLEPGEELVAGCFVSPRGAGLAFAGQMWAGWFPVPSAPSWERWQVMWSAPSRRSR